MDAQRYDKKWFVFSKNNGLWNSQPMFYPDAKTGGMNKMSNQLNQNKYHIDSRNEGRTTNMKEESTEQ